jgi:hypothetical protein
MSKSDIAAMAALQPGLVKSLAGPAHGLGQGFLRR